MTMEEYSERQQWFIDRIGKRVYRNPDSCGCESCTSTAKDGLEIGNKEHALYLYMIEQDFSAEGNLLRYFDSKEEVSDWMSKNNLN